MRKFILAFSLVIATLGTANAQFHGGRHHGGAGFHGGGGHHFRPQVNPFFFGIAQAPMFAQPQHGYCEIQKQWVETPYGMKKRRVRVCY